MCRHQVQRAAFVVRSRPQLFEVSLVASVPAPEKSKGIKKKKEKEIHLSPTQYP